MIIDQLPSVGTPSLTDETVTEQGQNLFKVTWQRLLALFKGNTTLSELSNDAGFVNAAGAAAAAPVQSVNGATGAVTVPVPTYNQTNITSGTHDLNDYTTPGLYYFSSGATLTNAPNSAVNGWLWVLAANNSVRKQIWIRHGSNPNTTKDFYMRFYSGSWGDWFGWMNRWELLWVNASPSSAFAAQTVALDLSGFGAVIIVNKHWSNNALQRSHYVPVDGNAYGCPAQNYAGAWAGRTCTASPSGIVFDTGVGTAADPSAAIPIEIYGIR